jgi:simple sugar transport system permease protein
MLVACACVGILGGALWGAIPALLKVRYGLNEIITTIMMNYVALFLTSWLVKGPFKDTTVVPPQTPLIPQGARLPAIPFTRIHIGLLIGIIVVLLAFFIYRNTVVGFQMTVLGKSRKAAVHAGMPVNRLIVLAFLVSAGMAGLAGANDVLGVKGMFQGEWNPGYGLTGFALVFLARINALLIIPFAYFFALLHFGGEMMSRTTQIPVFFVGILEGLMLVILAIGAFIERRVVRRWGGET